ncbi:MAG: C40 family peptidase [Negativicutes bacterium]|nr:C40 family peptidase [Negativicutes bacterium]
MRKYKYPIVIALLMAFVFTIILPVALANAAPASSLVSTVDSNDSSSGSGNNILNVLMGLLLGKLFGNMTDTDSSAAPNSSKVLSADSKTTTSGQALITTGQKYMGVPYVWGGETPSGFDCSGFTQYVMKQNGIQIPRTAAEQYATGKSVEKAKLQVGDLVFFTTYKPGASHVGFYMGDGKFLHASSAAKQVAINSLDEQYYIDHYIGARTYHR